MAAPDSRWWLSNGILYALLVLGLVAGLVATFTDGRAEPSFLWFVDDELIVCRTWGPFDEPPRETYRFTRIEAFEVASDAFEPTKRVVRIRFDQLNLNIPLQSDLVVDDLGAYVDDLNRWLMRVKAGDVSARCWYVQPALLIDSLSWAVAVPAWLILFALIGMRMRRRQELRARRPRDDAS
ncbi:MAG: hypothetical protein V2I67_03410 [Thermoanaerobaculales bacterium]|nr:hypothetical protein [Thermoanaerobaculales bacterium]